MYTCILIILLHYHLAGDLVLINCQNVINYGEIVMYIQFYVVQNTSDIIYNVNKFCQVENKCMYVMQI